MSRTDEIRERVAASANCRAGKIGCVHDDSFRCAIHAVTDSDIVYLLAENERLRGEMEPVRWFRINTPDGSSLWMETSDEEEARSESAKTGWQLERLFKAKQAEEWRPVASPVAEEKP